MDLIPTSCGSIIVISTLLHLFENKNSSCNVGEPKLTLINYTYQLLNPTTPVIVRLIWCKNEKTRINFAHNKHISTGIEIFQRVFQTISRKYMRVKVDWLLLITFFWTSWKKNFVDEKFHQLCNSWVREYPFYAFGSLHEFPKIPNSYSRNVDFLKEPSCLRENKTDNIVKAFAQVFNFFKWQYFFQNRKAIIKFLK